MEKNIQSKVEKLRQNEEGILGKNVGEPPISYRYIRSLIEATIDPLVAINVEGRITDVNVATENATGFPRSYLIGTDFSDYFTDPEEARIGYQKVFEQGILMDYPLVLRDKSNKLSQVLYNASLFHNERGKVLGVIAIAHVLNKRKRAAELIIANKELAFQNSEKEKRLEELILANIEKDKRAEELVIANEEIEKLAAELITTNKKLAFQNKEIIDSINYARIIQNAIFPSKKQLEEILPNSFVLAKPKNIVSGDFHWIEKHKNKVFIAVSDCTGHGVPGAFISIIGYKLLTKFIIEYGLSNPSEILNQLNNEFFVSDKQIIDSVFEIKDGLDIALCVVDKSKMKMMYAGAYNPVYQIRKGKFAKLSVDKIPIHLFTRHTEGKFTNHEIKIEKGDIYYMLSDGYASQFGGTKGKKFMRKNLQELILSVQHLTLSEQKEVFNNSIEEWKNAFGEEQTDDILILGFKIT